jgi:hypothetical protein
MPLADEKFREDLSQRDVVFHVQDEGFAHERGAHEELEMRSSRRRCGRSTTPRESPGSKRRMSKKVVRFGGEI